MKFCPQCGSQFESQARFCQECGFDSHSPEQTGEQQHVQQTPGNIKEPPVKSGCPQCGNHMVEGERFCPECGFDTTKVPQIPPAPESEPHNATFCSNCGSPLAPDDRFCLQCGTKVEAPQEAVPEPQQTVTPPVVPVQAAAPGHFCPNCGSALAPGDVFCQECGFKQTDAAGAPPVEEPEPVVAAPPPVVEEVVAPEPPQPEPEVIAKSSPVEAELPPPPPPSVPEPVAEVPAATPGQFCPNCGSPMNARDVFCQECGFKQMEKIDAPPVTEPEPVVVAPPPIVEEVVAPEPPQPKPEVVAEPAPAEAELPPPPPPPVPKPVAEVPAAAPGQFCPNCGSPMNAGDMFCQECGFKQTDVVEAATGEEVKREVVVPVAPVAAKEKPPRAPEPPKPSKKQVAETRAPEPQAVFVEQEKKKKKSPVLLIILLLLGLGVLGAGGWFGYKHFFADKKSGVAETTVIDEEIKQPVSGPDVLVQEEVFEDEPEAEEPVEEAPVVKEPEKKAAPPKKPAPPKQQEPQRQQPVQEEPKPEEKPTGLQIQIVKEPKTPRTLYTTFNAEPVKGSPSFDNKVKFSKAMVVTRIITFHYNGGQGAVAGTIYLEGKKGAGGAWQARNAPGSDGNPLGKWICEPNERFEAGNYKLTVSDTKSWSTNPKAGKKGMVIIEGYEAD